MVMMMMTKVKLDAQAFARFVNPSQGGPLSPSDLEGVNAVESQFWSFIDGLPVDDNWRANGSQAMLWCSPVAAKVIKDTLNQGLKYDLPSTPRTSFWDRMHQRFWLTQLPDVQPSSANARVCAYYSLDSDLVAALKIEPGLDYLYVSSLRVSNNMDTGRSSVQVPDIGSLNVINAVKNRLANVSPNTKIMLSVGGWNGGDDSAMDLMTSDQDRIDSFVETCIMTCQGIRAAGIDIDWQYPDSEDKRNQFEALMLSLSTALHEQGLLVSCTVTGIDDFQTVTPEYADDAITIESHVTDINARVLAEPNLVAAIDFLNVQAFDMGNGKQGLADTVQSLAYWGSVLPSLSKLNMGIPCHAKGGMVYRQVLTTYGLDAAWSDSAGGKFYNGVDTVRNKVQDVIDTGAGGVFFSDYLADYLEDKPLSLVATAQTLIDQEQSPVTSTFDQYGLIGPTHLISGPANIPDSLVGEAIFIMVPATQMYSRDIRPVVEQALQEI